LLSSSRDVYVIPMKWNPSDQDRMYCFFAGVQQDRRASQRLDRRCGLVTAGFLARPVCVGMVSDWSEV
jgi:hypothetical protein